jgi:hypothetical protein
LKLSTRYRYAADTGQYIDLETNKAVPLNKIRLSGLELGQNGTEIDAELELLKHLQSTRKSVATEARNFKRAESSQKSQPSRTQLLNESFDRVRESLVDSVKFHIKEETRVIYYVDANNEVYPCYKEDYDGFELLIMRHRELHNLLRLEFEEDYNAALRANLDFEGYLKETFSRLKFELDAELASEPAPLSWEPSIPAYKQLNPSILQPTATPTWDQFTSRLDFPDHFKAFVWSIFEPRNKGRQALYLYGAGFDGKSSAFNAVANVLGDRHTMSIDNEKLKNTQFFYGNVHGKRLVLYPDCKVTSVIRHEVIKSLLGNDKVQVNRKNRDAFNSNVYVKLMIGSNRYPRIDSGDKSERTRLMFLKIKPISDTRGDHNFEPNLRAEIGPFLYQCRAAYELLCPTHSEFELPQAMQDNIRNECNSADADSLEDFIAENLVVDPTGFLIKRELDLELRGYILNNNIKRDATNSIDTLQVKLASHNIYSKRLRLSTGARLNCLVGVTLRTKPLKLKDVSEE